MLEDEATDIVHKAARGLGLPVPPHGTPDELRAAAQTLHLNPDALLAVADGRYDPAVPCPDGLQVVTTPFKGFTVNAYRIGGVCFDTGTDATGLLRDGTPEALFITHHHPRLHLDHIADLRRFEGCEIHAPEQVPLEGSFQIGGVHIECRPTPGHYFHDTTYVVSHPSLAHKIAVTGDILFAGSIGAPNISYQQVLENTRNQLFTLPDDTVLCPGHGPLTTVGLEKMHNPFFA